MVLVVSGTGILSCVYTEAIDLEALGTMTAQRASNVEPGPGGWCAEIVDGPTLGPFTKRSQAISAEVAWIEENVL